mmetsp:Transcript_71169/g.164562  ORF Transcript_71169/g.164562 Transcript_71169/m.164562 type:complete len:216 (-) Transcript_71169:750-1397(-)
MAKGVLAFVPQVGPLLIKRKAHAVPGLHLVRPLDRACVSVEARERGIDVVKAIVLELRFVAEQRLLQDPLSFNHFPGLAVDPLHGRVEHIGTISQDHSLPIRRNAWEVHAGIGQDGLPKHGTVLHAVLPQAPGLGAPAVHGGLRVWSIATGVDAAIRAKDIAPIRHGPMAPDVPPDLRAVEEIYPVQPTAIVHEDRGVIVGEKRHDIPDATVWSV